MRRVLVAGISGCGKTTLARRLSVLIGVPHIELDALHHGPGWTVRPDFERDVAGFAATDGWVVDSFGYPSVRDLLWARVDTVVWLDLPRRTVMWRVLRRSALRAATRRELWNGNRERFADWLDPEHPIRWAWSQHAGRRIEIGRRLAEPRHAHLRAVRLRSPAQARRWLATVERNPGYTRLR